MTHARRSGATVLEAAVALTLGLLVLHLMLVSVRRSREGAARLLHRADVLESFRVSRFVPRRELRFGRPGVDWLADADSIRMRAFRGTALVCAPDGESTEVVVSYRGDRLPDPDKDSVLVIDASGTRGVTDLLGVGPGGSSCGLGPGDPATWRLGQAIPADAVLLRLFERGSYHLSSGALRYRRGAGGRQPLTPEVWADSTSWSLSTTALRFVYRPRRTGRRWSGFLAWRE